MEDIDNELTPCKQAVRDELPCANGDGGVVGLRNTRVRILRLCDRLFFILSLQYPSNPFFRQILPFFGPRTFPSASGNTEGEAHHDIDLEALI